MSRATGYVKTSGLARSLRLEKAVTKAKSVGLVTPKLHFDAEVAAMKAQRRGSGVLQKAREAGKDEVQAYMDYSGSRGVVENAARQRAHRTGVMIRSGTPHRAHVGGFSKSGEEPIIPTSPADAMNRVVENEHPHGRFSRLRKLWSKITGSDPVGLKKEAFSRLDAGRKAVKRGLMPSFHINDLKDLNDRAVSVPKTMQLQSGKGPIVRRETQWKKMTERGGRFSDAQEHLSGQVMKHVPMQETDKKYVAFKKAASASKGLLAGLSDDLAKSIIEGRIAKKQALKGIR